MLTINLFSKILYYKSQKHLLVSPKPLNHGLRNAGKQSLLQITYVSPKYTHDLSEERAKQY